MFPLYLIESVFVVENFISLVIEKWLFDEGYRFLKILIKTSRGILDFIVFGWKRYMFLLRFTISKGRSFKEIERIS